jgi:aminoglycoside phosphotransferase (APT) family kinase protein
MMETETNLGAACGRIDFVRVSAWMDEIGLPPGEIEKVQPLAGGTQNVLLQFRRGTMTYVLRRGPWHLRPRSNDAIRREMRVLAGLARTGVPHPALIAGCPDEVVLGDAAFYLMEAVDGFNASVALPALHAGDQDLRRAMGFAAVDALVALGNVDVDAVGLGDLGRPDGFLERQVPRWLAELESHRAHPGYPGPDIPGLSDVATWLEANRPVAFRPGLSHGDFHLANLMYRFDGPDVAAVIDWEMATVGDPLLDLGWLLATWPVGGDPVLSGALGEAGGLPRRDELIARYCEQSTRDLSDVAWYEVLACFKLGIILEGTYARAFAGLAPRETGDLLHTVTLALFTRANSVVQR